MSTGFKISGLDHAAISVPVGREAEVLPFYSGVLGLASIPLPESVQGRNIHWFALGTQELHVIPEGEVHASVRHPALTVDDVEAARERLIRAGIEPMCEPDLPGCVRFSFFDPFGNKIEIIKRQTPADVE